MCDKTIEYIEHLLNDIQKESNEKSMICKQYGIKNIGTEFNIFTSISDMYKRENLHSDILANILDPHTPEIGSLQYLKIFMKLLHDKNKTIKVYNFTESVKVEREKGRIDVFIHDDAYGIIIENKINGAVDQKDQLFRYLEYARSKEIEVIAFVYIPLNPNKTPQITSYDCSDDDKQEISNKLVILSAIDENRKDLAHGFLDKCVEVSKGADNYTAWAYYLEHYSNLIKKLGGDVMTKESDKKILKKIFSCKENIMAIKSGVDVWSKRIILLKEIFTERLSNELEFSKNNDDLLKDLGNGIYLGFIAMPELCTFGLVCNAKKVNNINEQKEKFKKLLNINDFKTHFMQACAQCIQNDGKPYITNDNFHWVWKNIKLTDEFNTIEEMGDFLIDKYKTLEGLFNQCISKQ